jgi:hypothetical protein
MTGGRPPFSTIDADMLSMILNSALKLAKGFKASEVL